jgi:hypothetical protein
MNASTLIGFTVMQRLEKMEASTRTFPLPHYYPVRTDTKELWEEGNVMLGSMPRSA